MLGSHSARLHAQADTPPVDTLPGTLEVWQGIDT